MHRKVQPKSAWSPKARYLFKLFTALRLVRQSNKWRFITACKASRTCFCKLEQILDESNVTDELGFLLSQINYWGISKIYPSHLISPYAVSIYRRWKEEQAPIAEQRISQEEKMLEALCKARKEPREKVLHFLDNSGLFSREFIDQNLH